MSIEAQVAEQLANKDRVAAILARTGGEIMHPDHYDFREAFRNAVLAAMDECSDEHEFTKVLDADLPELFKALDPLAEKLWLRSLGVKV